MEALQTATGVGTPLNALVLGSLALRDERRGETRSSPAASLSERLALKESGAEEEFAGSYARRILTALRLRVRDKEAAKELTNDVLMAVLNAVNAGRLQDPAKLSAFVMGTARNLANNYCRMRGRRPSETALLEDVAAADQCASADQRERMILVFRNLHWLDEIDRSVVVLTLAHGLKPGEIARALKLSPQVVRTRKCRAIRRLAVLLRPASPGTSRIAVETTP